MMNKLDLWDALIRDYKTKFEKDDISDKMRQAALFAVAPEAVVENSLAGRRENSLDDKCHDQGQERSEENLEPRVSDSKHIKTKNIKLSGGGNQSPPPVDQSKLREMTSSRKRPAKEGATPAPSKSSQSLERNALKGKSKGKGKKKASSTGGRWKGTSLRQNAAGNRQPLPQPEEAGRGIEKPKEKGKGKGRSGGKAKCKEKGLTCFVCGGVGHPARLCTSEAWVNDLEQAAPKGEDTNEDGCWTEEDDETLQLEYFGSDSFLMSSPPGLRDSFNKTGQITNLRRECNVWMLDLLVKRPADAMDVLRFQRLCR